MEGHADPLFDVSGLRVLVTGAAGEIGRVFVGGLAERGCRVVAVDRDEDGLRTAVADWPESVLPFTTDITDESAVTRLFREDVAGALGGLDVLVNNAGILRRLFPEETTLTDWRDILGVNLDGAFLCARMAGELMLEQGQGTVVNISSIASVKALDRRIAYCTSKAALSHMTRMLALEWGARGIRVNAIAPGYIRTRLNADIRSDPRRLKEWTDAVPLKRFADPKELLGALLFLASPAARYVNGHILFVDGGLQVT